MNTNVIRGGDVAAPGIDFITEKGFEADETVVATGNQFHPEVKTHLSGQKYVSARTVQELVAALGWPTPADYTKKLQQIEYLENRLKEVEARAEALDVISKQLEVLGIAVPDTPEETPQEIIFDERTGQKLPSGYIAGPREIDGYLQSSDGNWAPPPMGWRPEQEPIPTPSQLTQQADENAEAAIEQTVTVLAGAAARAAQEREREQSAAEAIKASGELGAYDGGKNVKGAGKGGAITTARI